MQARSGVLDPLVRVGHHTPALDRSVAPVSRVTRLLTLAPTARNNESSEILGRPGHNGIAYRLLYGLATRLSNLGIRGCFSGCYFFYIGGILSLPYQFYHHRVCVLCDRRKFFLKNLIDTDHLSTVI